MLYPAVSSRWNARRQSRAVAGYVRQAAQLDREVRGRLRQEAETYNRSLEPWQLQTVPTREEHRRYSALLNLSSSGIMGYLEIPDIQVELPICHGIAPAVLQAGVGHLEGSALPVGGPDTHCVLTGHRGLPSARLLTDLDQLSEGDLFFLHVLGETMAYEVDQILVVEPDDFRSLTPLPGQDLCTLLTCTPYGVNSHRLLVRGRRTALPETPASGPRAEAQRLDPAFGMLAAGPALLLWLWTEYRRAKKHK